MPKSGIKKDLRQALRLKLQLIENLVAKKLHLTSLRRSSKSAKCHLS